MELSLPFVTSSAPQAAPPAPMRKKKKMKKSTKRNIKKPLIKIRSEYTPMEIMNMDIPEIQYLYEHGSPTERDMADNILRARLKFQRATMLSDDVINQNNTPNPGAPTAYVVGQNIH
jgi:hypothetical protein